VSKTSQLDNRKWGTYTEETPASCKGADNAISQKMVETWNELEDNGYWEKRSEKVLTYSS